MDRNLLVLILYIALLVALRKESVDRNKLQGTFGNAKRVALRKESVDRNIAIDVLPQLLLRRSPQGERG